MEYQPGDVANGHVLGTDGVWHPIQQPPSSVHPASNPQKYPAPNYVEPRKMGYWAKFRLRIWWCIGAMFVFTVVSLFIGSAAEPGRYATSFIDLFLAGFLNSIVFGIPIGFVAALFPSKKRRA